MAPPTVCACVLTRNRSRLLEECLDGLAAQTHPLTRVVVVDNASTDSTPTVLAGRDGIEAVRLEINTGGAGGFAEAVRLGRETGADWLWLMDDDAEPAPDALERMLAAAPATDPGTAVLCSTVRQPDGAIEVLHRGHVGRFMIALPEAEYARPGAYPSLGFASFVGFLVRGDVARAMELPRAEFFIGCDDVEYSVRARRFGAIRLVPDSVIVHKLGMGGGSVTARSRLFNRLLGAGWTSAPWAGYWKQLYALRNFVWIRRHHGRVGPLAVAGITAAYVVKALLYDDRPLRRIPWLVRFAWRGARADFSPSPTPAEWAAVADAA